MRNKHGDCCKTIIKEKRKKTTKKVKKAVKANTMIVDGRTRRATVKSVVDVYLIVDVATSVSIVLVVDIATSVSIVMIANIVLIMAIENTNMVKSIIDIHLDQIHLVLKNDFHSTFIKKPSFYYVLENIFRSILQNIFESIKFKY